MGDIAPFARAKTRRIWLPLAAALLAAASLQTAAATTLVRGRVVMEDGSPPGKPVGIERYCLTGVGQVGVTDRKGAFLVTLDIDPMTNLSCVLRANRSGYESTVIEISSFNWLSDPNLPPIVLRHSGPGNADADLDVFSESGVPPAARPAWGDSVRASRSKNWAQAEQHLQAVVKAAPEYAAGWYALGFARAQLHKPSEAEEALRQAVARNPKLSEAYLLLARVSVEAHDWQATTEAAAGLIKVAPKKMDAPMESNLAVARYFLKDLDGAESAAAESIRLDTRREFPRNEYVLGVILEGKRDFGAAREHLSKYLELAPRGADADDVRTRIANLGKSEASALPLAEDSGAAEPVTAEGEAWVPGGRKALAAIAHLEEVPSYADFFPKYCRAIADEIKVGTSRGIPAYTATIRAYLAAVSGMTVLGERRENRTAITLSVATDAARKRTEQVLEMLGWRLTRRKDGTFTAEPGNQPADGLHQPIPAALGIDEINMQKAIEAGREFVFEIPTENAQFTASDTWNGLLKNVPALPPGGIAAVLATDGQLAKTCAGLGAMGPPAAAAVISAVGLRNLATRYADVLARYGAAFAIGAKEIATPGGDEAEPAWRKLAGVSPRNGPAFLRAIFERQQGKLAAFYFALSQADAAHQRFFTKTPQRAERFFAWYKQAEEFRYGQARQVEGWRSEFFRKLPLDMNGNVRFPGGKGAWSASPRPDEDILVSSQTIEALAPLAELEAKRGTKLDEASARLLVQHFTEWRPLFPYFESMPSLGAEEFRALAGFADRVSEDSLPEQSAVLGEWYSLVELINRGVKAGALDGPTTARAFRQISVDLLSPDHAVKALRALRNLAGGGTDLNESVAGNLLRLTGSRRAAFDRVLRLQNVPRLDAAAEPRPAQVLAVLSGYVYAASLDPDTLLLNQDSRLLSKHRFIARPNERRTSLFQKSAVILPGDASGAYFSGGFGNFDEVTRRLARAAPAAAVASSGSAASAASPAPATEGERGSITADFSVTGRLVEVYATVTDSRGKYIDDLTADQFTVVDEDNPQHLGGFEPQTSDVSCALLLDTTGSMGEALPSLKNAALKLIGDLRRADSVAVYSFNESVSEMQTLTTDKAAAERAVLRAQAMGNTALYDALTRVSLDLTGLGGKKVIVVFTDGKDNASSVTAESVVNRAKAAGVPVYTIAEGDAVIDPALLAQLAGISKATGGEAFVIRSPAEIGRVFEKVSEDLAHGYLLSFPPPPAANNGWHPIEVRVSAKGAKVRAREGYFPQPEAGQ